MNLHALNRHELNDGHQTSVIRSSVMNREHRDLRGDRITSESRL